MCKLLSLSYFTFVFFSQLRKYNWFEHRCNLIYEIVFFIFKRKEQPKIINIGRKWNSYSYVVSDYRSHSWNLHSAWADGEFPFFRQIFVFLLVLMNVVDVFIRCKWVDSSIPFSWAAMLLLRLYRQFIHPLIHASVRAASMCPHRSSMETI